ncbi:MAG TPA: M13 family metallopeptidase [Gemmatimonadaceae bacterium]|nr:M13 family metallopeptidase [Gemmatimonadaceae bacterium]
MRRICIGLIAVFIASTAGAQGTHRQTRPLDPVNLDTTCAPCTNFYQFANGGWMKANPIPAAYSQWGAFNELADNNNENVRKVLDDAVRQRTTSPDVDVRKVGNFYAACMDSAGIEKAGYTPIKASLAEIAALRTPADVRQYIINEAAAGRGVLFRFGSTQDAKNSSEVIGGIGQGGIGLPDRDYYFKTDAHTVELRDAYVKHVANDLVLVGESPEKAAADAKSILALETSIAASHLTRVESRNPELTYNRKTPAELQAMTPDFNWNAFFAAEKAHNVTAINVANPKFVTTADSLLRTVPVSEWKTYFTWNLVNRSANTLSSPFVNEAFAFNQNLTGAKEQLPRYKRCITATDRALGEALGKAYVKRYFTPEAKARATAMVNNIKAVFRERLATRTWMSDSTRRMAYAKLDAFAQKIGYPDKWKDYSALTITPGASYFDNSMAVAAFNNADDIARINKPVDRTRWGMTPPTVNAYYNALMNEIVFPAGIMQPPFFDPNADDAVNYGGMGAVIGHEMSHGFDDQGAQFDAQGNLKTWFTKADLANFKAKTAAYADQFDTYTILDSVHVNGKLTNGENIGDLGGLTIAYAAMEKALGNKPRTKIDGFTPEQRFFLAWAQIWRSNTRPEEARLRIATDPHSPSIWRVNAPLSNMPAFAEAWGCKTGTPMARPASESVAIW